MPILPKDNNYAKDAAVKTKSYRGPDRRDGEAENINDTITREVHYDDKGNPVLSVRTHAQRRREGDKTIDLLKCLDAGELDLEEEA